MNSEDREDSYNVRFVLFEYFACAVFFNLAQLKDCDFSSVRLFYYSNRKLFGELEIYL